MFCLFVCRLKKMLALTICNVLCRLTKIGVLLNLSRVLVYIPRTSEWGHDFRRSKEEEANEEEEEEEEEEDYLHTTLEKLTILGPFALVRGVLDLLLPLLTFLARWAPRTEPGPAGGLLRWGTLLPLLLMAVMMRCFIRSRCCICRMRFVMWDLQSLQLILLWSGACAEVSLDSGKGGKVEHRSISCKRTRNVRQTVLVLAAGIIVWRWWWTHRKVTADVGGFANLKLDHEWELITVMIVNLKTVSAYVEM